MIETPPTRKLTIIAKDPGLRIGGPRGPMAFVEVSVPAELLSIGPVGYRIKVVDYNSTENHAYSDEQKYQNPDGTLRDPFACGKGETLIDPAYQQRLLASPNFHAQNAYAIAMRTLGVFERALGRRVSWRSGGHQLHIAPHAFAQENAFYSGPDRALFFGYFFGVEGPIYTCLSHDIVAHETTHALLDGLRPHFTEASGPDQAAFHEGFADIVALLSIFSLKTVVAAAIGEDAQYRREDLVISLVDAAKVQPEAIKASILLGIAADVGRELSADRGALRRSVKLAAAAGSEARKSDDEHDRGEVIVAAMMNAFVRLWSARIQTLGTFDGDRYNLSSVVDEGAELAGHLLTMSVRALDYCPPTDLDFGEYLAALLTSDREVVPEDDRNYRGVLRDTFAEYGIVTPATGCDVEGCWRRFETPAALNYARSNYQAMTRSPDELFRFLWENRDALGLSPRAYSEVLSIDPASRTGPDGIALHETVCQYVQRYDMFGAEFKELLGCERPAGMSSRDRYTAFGGGVLILDQYGQVKYHIANRIDDKDRQFQRAEYLLGSGQLNATGGSERLQFALLHLERMGA